MLRLLLIIGSVFALLAACSAFLIAREEYQKHQFTGRQLFRMSFQVALAAFLFFLMLTLAGGYFISKNSQ
jgi:hypothetical protein